jgi:5'-deoxynucleotidase
MLPEDLRPAYEGLFFKEESEQYLWKLVKAADKISALVKCIEERKAGNTEFSSAEQTIRKNQENSQLEEVAIFFKEFLPAYEKTLDELN